MKTLIIVTFLMASVANAKIYRVIECDNTADSRTQLIIQVSDKPYHLGSKIQYRSNRGILSRKMKVSKTGFSANGDASFTVKSGRYENIIYIPTSKLSPWTSPVRAFDGFSWTRGEVISHQSYRCTVIR